VNPHLGPNVHEGSAPDGGIVLAPEPLTPYNAVQLEAVDGEFWVVAVNTSPI
jgi:hypothetical protein